MKAECTSDRSLQLIALLDIKKNIQHFYWMFGGASCRIRTNDPEITNHVLWPTELKRRVDKLLTSHRSTFYLCYIPILEDSKGAGRVRLARIAVAKVYIILYIWGGIRSRLFFFNKISQRKYLVVEACIYANKQYVRIGFERLFDEVDSLCILNISDF